MKLKYVIFLKWLFSIYFNLQQMVIIWQQLILHTTRLFHELANMKSLNLQLINNGNKQFMTIIDKFTNVVTIFKY